MQELIVIEKQIGETPLAALDRYRNEHPEYADVKMTYAGRLDPLAEGLLLVLAGERVHEKEAYIILDKEYEVQVLLGISTDSYDALGLVTSAVEAKPCHVSEVQEILKSFVGTFDQEYPPYSSKTVDGKPLWQYARSGMHVQAPKRTVTVQNIDFLGLVEVSGHDLHKQVVAKIASVTGDFRQTEILESWGKALKNHENTRFQVISVRVMCSSGTYMRSLAHEIGKKLDIPAFALGITRTKIGDFKLDK